MERFTSVILGASAPVDLVVEGAHKFRDEIRRHQLVAQGLDYPSFDLAPSDACPIIAGSLASGSGAGYIVLADRRG